MLALSAALEMFKSKYPLVGLGDTCIVAAPFLDKSFKPTVQLTLKLMLDVSGQPLAFVNE
jgi:hypothetical protein